MRTYSLSQIQKQIKAATGGELKSMLGPLEKAVFYIDFDEFMEIKGSSDEDDVKEFFALNPYVLDPDQMPVFAKGKFYMFRLFKDGDILMRSELVKEFDSFPNVDDEVFAKERKACEENSDQVPYVQVVAIPGNASSEYQGIACACMLNVQTRELCTDMLLFTIDEARQVH